MTLSLEWKLRAEKAEARVEELETLLRRVRGWDVLNPGNPGNPGGEELADGPYWRRAIDAALDAATAKRAT